MENKTITFEDIQKANENIKMTTLKNEKSGKVIGDYAEVNQRIKAFKIVYPEGTIMTKMTSNENGICIFRAYVYNGDKLLGTGTAYEKENSTFINKTSYIENCETSAVGRALGMAGFGIDTSIASAEEVQNAVINQEKDEEIDYKSALEEYIQVNKLDKVEICKKYKLSARSKNDAFKKAFLDLTKGDVANAS